MPYSAFNIVFHNCVIKKQSPEAKSLQGLINKHIYQQKNLAYARVVFNIHFFHPDFTVGFGV